MPPHLFAPGGVHELVSMQLWAWFWLQMWLLTRLKPWGGRLPVYPFTRLITQIVVVFLGSCKLLFRSESDVTSYRSPNVDGSSSGIRSLEAFTGCQGCACGAAGAMRLQETHCDAKVR